MTSELTAGDIRGLPKREPNATCGDARVTFVSRQACRARSAGGSQASLLIPGSTPADRGQGLVLNASPEWRG
jgi:hypothetical protein